MMSDGGLPDYIADHFRYLVRCSKPARLGQLAFFGLGLLVALAGPFFLPDLVNASGIVDKAILFVGGAAFVGSFLWYVTWFQERRDRFRKEMPASYARWFGARRRSPFGGLHLKPNLRLAHIQIRYLLTSQEPSPNETLALTLDFARHSLV